MALDEGRGESRARWLPPIERPLDALQDLTDLRAAFDRLERLLVAEARRGKWTWEEIGGALGVSRQAAHRRHARAVNRSSGV